MRLGLIVNPIAGLGGTVGLRGTDGPDAVAEAIRRGATAQAGRRARRTLARLGDAARGHPILAAPGALGADWAAGLGLDLRVLDLPAPGGTARDTRAAVAAMGDTDLVLFAGGDGTARDVASALPPGAAMLGIPAGVKMQSGVFAISPEAAARVLLDAFEAGDRLAWGEAEVMDIDEAALRAGRIEPRLFALARVPATATRPQAAKGRAQADAAARLAGVAAEIAAEMRPGPLYVLGPGTSAGAVARALGVEPTLLGVDAIRDGRLVARDASAPELERLAGEGEVRIVLGVTGRQGFLLGRGNQQVGPALVRRAGRDGLVVLATDDKLAGLAAPRLWVDTGEPDLDAALAGYVRVRTAPGRVTLMRVGAS